MLLMKDYAGHARNFCFGQANTFNVVNSGKYFLHFFSGLGLTLFPSSLENGEHVPDLFTRSLQKL